MTPLPPPTRDCRRLREMIQQALDTRTLDSLLASPPEPIAGHLPACPRCRSELHTARLLAMSEPSPRGNQPAPDVDRFVAATLAAWDVSIRSDQPAPEAPRLTQRPLGWSRPSVYRLAAMIALAATAGVVTLVITRSDLPPDSIGPAAGPATAAARPAPPVAAAALSDLIRDISNKGLIPREIASADTLRGALGDLAVLADPGRWIDMAPSPFPDPAEHLRPAPSPDATDAATVRTFIA